MIQRRKGFTLIELLVVVAIIGVLIGLLLPAVQKVREASNRLKCQNNLKQMGVALHGYESAYEQFPPAGKSYGWTYSMNGSTADPVIYNTSGLLLLLPFLEQEPLYKAFDLAGCNSNQMSLYSGSSQPAAAGSLLAGNSATNGNGALASTRLSIFTCPSDSGNPMLSDTGAYGPTGTQKYQGAKTNYDFCVSSAYYANAWKTMPGNRRRIFGENSTTRASDVIDGTSNTIAMGEGTFDRCNGSCNAWAYRGWVQVGVDPGMRGINDPIWPGSPRCSTPVKGQLGGWGYAGSLHTGGCNFVFADGAVRFIAESTPLTVLEQLSAMADGQAVEVP